jgi:hypothetical protein
MELLEELQVCDAAFPGRLLNELNHHSQISDAFGVPERVRLSFKSVSEREVWGEYTGESNPIVKIDLRDWLNACEYAHRENAIGGIAPLADQENCRSRSI